MEIMSKNTKLIMITCNNVTQVPFYYNPTCTISLELTFISTCHGCCIINSRYRHTRMQIYQNYILTRNVFDIICETQYPNMCSFSAHL